MKIKEKQVKIISVADMDFYYRGVDITYSREYDCENQGCYDDMCRCSRIVDAEVKSIDFDKVVNAFGFTGIDEYAVDRILRINKLYESSNWTIKSSGGYYGDEIDGVYIDDLSTVNTHLSSVLYLPTDDLKIEELLRLEYGYVLPEVQNRTWQQLPVEKRDIIFGQEDHHFKLNMKVISEYTNYGLARGIAIPKGKKYRLIDGYHRCAAVPDGQNLIIWVGRNENN